MVRINKGFYFKKFFNLQVVAILALLIPSACELNNAIDSDASFDSKGGSFKIETVKDGSGQSITNLNIEQSKATTIYAVERSKSGKFLGNVEVAWVLLGNVGSLNIASDGKSAVFTAENLGLGSVKASIEKTSVNLEINVIEPLNPKVDFSIATQDVVEGSSFGLNVDWHPGISWLRRKKLSFNNSAQTENLLNYPVLIRLNSSRISYLLTQDAGQDIRFYDSDGTLLAHEIEKWDESGDSNLWVKIPQIDGNSTTDYIWVYYGNDTAPDGQNSSGTWSANYRSVWHMQNMQDSSSYANTAQNQNSTDSPGNISQARNFAGSDEGMSVGDSTVYDLTNFTVDFWVKLDAFGNTSTYRPLLYKGRTNSNRTFGLWLKTGTNAIIHHSFTSGGTYYSYDSVQELTLNTWHHVAYIHNQGQNVQLYIDGNLDVVTSVPSLTPGSGNVPIYIGADGTEPYGSLLGSMDEIRISDQANSADWIKAQYLSMTDVFVTFASEEILLPGETPVSIAVELSHVWDQDVVIPLTITGTATTAIDHDLGTDFSLTVPSGTTSALLSLNLSADLEVESDESIIVSMSEPTEARLGSLTEHTITIVSDDYPPSITVNDINLFEGESKQVSIVLDHMFGSAVQVNYQTNNGSATAPTDYTTISGTAYFPGGSLVQKINIVSFTDLVDEGTENLSVDLSTAVNGTIVDPQATVNIDNNFDPTVVNEGPLLVEAGSALTVNVLVNDSDVDGDTIFVSNFDTVSTGSLAITNGGDLTYNTNGVFNGVATLNYTVSDGKGGFTAGSVTVFVMTAQTWTGDGGDTNWTNVLNWCGTVTAGVCQGAGSIPSGSQVAIFNGTCVANCSPTIDSAISVGGIKLDADYTGTVTQGIGNIINISTKSFNQAGGTFIGSDASINILTYSTSEINISGGNFTSTSGTLTFRYVVKVASSVNFNHNNGKFLATSDCGCSSTRSVFDSGTNRFFDLEINRYGGITPVGTIFVDGGLTITGSASSGGVINGTIRLQGDLTMVASNGYYASGQIILEGTNNQTINHIGGTIPRANFTIDKPSGTVSLASDLSLMYGGEVMSILSGTLDLAGFNLNVSGSLNMSAGALITRNLGTVTVNSVVLTDGPHDLGSIQATSGGG